MNRDKLKRTHFIEINQVGFEVKPKKRTIIPKEYSAAQILVKSNFRSETGLFQSKENSYFLSSNNLLPPNGIFKVKENIFAVTVLNVGAKAVVLPKKDRREKNLLRITISNDQC